MVLEIVYSRLLFKQRQFVHQKIALYYEKKYQHLGLEIETAVKIHNIFQKLQKSKGEKNKVFHYEMENNMEMKLGAIKRKAKKYQNLSNTINTKGKIYSYFNFINYLLFYYFIYYFNKIIFIFI